VSGFLADRRPNRVNKDAVKAAGLGRGACALGVACFLALAGISGVSILGHSSALAQGRPAAAGNAENGKAVFSSQKCEACHGSQGQGGSGSVAGPQIAGLTMTLPMFIERVRNAQVPMPAYSASEVSDATLADVYAFLKSAGPGMAAPTVTAAAGNPANGKQLYVSAGCQLCHNGDGQGGGPGPALAPHPNMIAYAAFVHQCRQPSNNMPPYTIKVLSDQQLADIYSYLAKLPKPPDASSIPLLQ
jgi:mono/diheme cytochrome c family protein